MRMAVDRSRASEFSLPDSHFLATSQQTVEHNLDLEIGNMMEVHERARERI
jgi:hypothetical protein